MRTHLQEMDGCLQRQDEQAVQAEKLQTKLESALDELQKERGGWFLERGRVEQLHAQVEHERAWAAQAVAGVIRRRDSAHLPRFLRHP
jgi:hypothetical protein